MGHSICCSFFTCMITGLLTFDMTGDHGKFILHNRRIVFQNVLHSKNEKIVHF